MKLDASAEYAIRRLEAAGFHAWAVGGCVRDSLLGTEPADWDVCTSALPEQTRALFDRTAMTGERHGTVTALLDRPIEITTLRTEGAYLDRRHPSGVSFTDDIYADLARRDFTINAMACSLSGELVDPFGGERDLENRLLRCVGAPRERFNEDALRLLRALRFISRLGLTADPGTAAAIHECAPLIAEISVERIFSELPGILRGDFAAQALLEYSDVITSAIPELKPMVGFPQPTPHHIYDVWEHTVRAVAAAPRDDTVRLALLLHDMAKPAKFALDSAGVGHFMGHGAAGSFMADECLRRLRADRGTRELVTLLVRIHDDALPKSEAGMRRLLAGLGEDTFRKLVSIKRADGACRAPDSARGRLAALAEGEALAERILAEKPCLSAADLQIGGRELMELGVPQGPEIGRMLSALLGRVLDGKTENERGALLAEAEKLMTHGFEKVRVVLVRHAESASNAGPSGMFTGQLDVLLTPRGEEQARSLRGAPVFEGAEMFFVSDLRRAALTARQFSGSVRTVYDPRLRERSLGKFEGKTAAELQSNAEYAKYFDDPRFSDFRHSFTARAPGGESYADVCARVRTFWEEVRGAGYGKIVVVSHLCTLRCLMKVILGLSEEEALALKINNCEPIEIEG